MYFIELWAGTATSYVLDGPGNESRWEARFSASVLASTTHPHLARSLKKQ
jgi:hypothetical protein